MAEILSKEFLEQVNSIDPEMYQFLQETDIDESNRVSTESLRDSDEARKKFLKALSIQIAESKNLFEALPKTFTDALKKKDQHICKLLEIAPATQFTLEIREAFHKEAVQNLVLSWFNNANNVLSRYRLLNLTMGDIAEAALANTDAPTRVTVAFLRGLAHEEADTIQSEIQKFSKEHPDQPNLLNEQDAAGRTVAHYVAERGLQQVLFDNDADFSIQDNQGNTPMHVMAYNCHEKASADIFEDYIHYAAKKGFDFALLNHDGLSVLHIAAIEQYQRFPFPAKQNIKYILESAQANDLRINLNVLSRSGSTALFYLINHCRYQEANLLLDAGVDPAKCGEGADDRKPINEVDNQLAAIKQMQNTFEEGSDKFQMINQHIETLTSLRSRLSLPNIIQKSRESLLNSKAGFFSTHETCGPRVLSAEEWDSCAQPEKENRSGPGYGF